MNIHSIPIRVHRGVKVSYWASHHEKTHTDGHTPGNWTFIFITSLCPSKYDANGIFSFFFLLSTSLQSVQCSREPSYFTASNNFTSPWTDSLDRPLAQGRKSYGKHGLHLQETPKGARRLNCYQAFKVKVWSSHNHCNEGRALIKGDTLKIVGVKAAITLLPFSSYRMQCRWRSTRGVGPGGDQSHRGDKATKTSSVNY